MPILLLLGRCPRFLINSLGEPLLMLPNEFLSFQKGSLPHVALLHGYFLIFIFLNTIISGSKLHAFFAIQPNPFFLTRFTFVIQIVTSTDLRFSHNHLVKSIVEKLLIKSKILFHFTHVKFSLLHGRNYLKWPDPLFVITRESCTMTP